MDCLECGKNKLIVKNKIFNVDFKNEKIKVKSPAFVCKNCGFRFTDTEQMNILRKAVADKYRTNKRLLTSEQIKEFRKNLEMSQLEFAEYLKVGEASVKRWETYFVQDESQDDHIRLKCDRNFSELSTLLINENSIYTGYKKFDLQKLTNVILCLIDIYKSPLYINKALFYIDFLHYFKYKEGITGLRYCSLELGPCPDQYRTIFKFIKGKKYIKDSGRHDLLKIKKIKKSILSPSNIEVINSILKLGKMKSPKFIYELSHKEKAYIENPYPWQEISYEYSKDLLIKKYL